MAAPPVRFPIIADDQTDAGFRSAINKANSFSRGVKGAFAAIGVVGGVSLLSGVIKESIQFGDELNKAAIKAGVSGRTISELAYAAKQSDIALSDLSVSLRFMQKNLSEAASGSKAQKDAFDSIGVSITNLRQLQPDQQFELIADRISKIKDPADRARAATDLFGRSGANLLPLFEKGAAGIRAAREEAQKMGASLSNQQVEKLAAADDSIKRLSASWKGFATTLTASVAPALSKILDGLTELGNGTAMERVGRTYSQNAIAQYGTDQQRAALNASRLEGELGGRFSGPTQRSRRSSSSAATEGSGIPAYLEMVKTTALRFDEFQARLADDRALRDYISGLQDAYATNQALIEASDKGIQDGIESSLERIGDDLDLVAEKTFETTDAMSEFAKSASQNMQSDFATFLFDPFDGGVKGMAKGFVDTIRRMGAEVAASKVFDFLGSKAGTGGVAGFLGSLFGGARAGGGPVSSGKGYLVGEQGPEWFMPGSSGSIIPNNQLAAAGSSISIAVYNDNRGQSTPDPAAGARFAKQQADMIEAKIIDGLRRKRYAGV